ncbi:MAG: hypothetical protein H0U10_09210 [Chloroflexia bacterium]|nr:hypothetical protein [Chloroflexia bacterium]
MGAASAHEYYAFDAALAEPTAGGGATPPEPHARVVRGAAEVTAETDCWSTSAAIDGMQRLGDVVG